MENATDYFPLLNAVRNLQFVQKNCFQRAKQKKKFTTI